MSAPGSTLPHIYGTLILRDVLHARTVLKALGGTPVDVEDSDDADGTLDKLLSRIAACVDEVFSPTSCVEASQTVVTGGVKPGSAGLINVTTHPPAFAQKQVRARAEEFLDTCASIGVAGYIEVDVPGTYPDRMVHVLTPVGLYSEAAPSRFDRA